MGECLIESIHLFQCVSSIHSASCPIHGNPSKEFHYFIPHKASDISCQRGLVQYYIRKEVSKGGWLCYISSENSILFWYKVQTDCGGGGRDKAFRYCFSSENDTFPITRSSNGRRMIKRTEAGSSCRTQKYRENPYLSYLMWLIMTVWQNDSEGKICVSKNEVTFWVTC